MFRGNNSNEWCQKYLKNINFINGEWYTFGYFILKDTRRCWKKSYNVLHRYRGGSHYSKR